MTTNLKKILLTGTALVAVAAFATQARAATVVINGADQAVAADPAATPAINYLTNNTATVNSGISLSTAGDTVTTSANNQGTLTMAGGAQSVAGAVGAAGFALNVVNGGAAGGATTFSSTVNAATENLTGTGSITNTGLVTLGTLNLAGAGTVNLNGAGANTITNTVYNADGTVSLGDGANLTGNITTAATNTGTLTLAGASTVTGTVGTAANVLKAINAGAAAKTDTFTGLVNATTLSVTGAAGVVNLNGVGANAAATNFAADGTLSLGDGANLTGAITTALTNTGTLTLAGSSTVTGAVGTGAAVLKAVNAGAAAKTDTFTGLVNATAVNVTGTGTVNLNGAGANVGTTTNFGGDGLLSLGDGANLTGNITTTTTNTGTLTLAGSSTVTGTVGAVGAVVKAVNAGATGKTDTITGLVNATTVNVTGTGTVNLNGAGANAAAANFGGNGTLSLGAGANLTGNITTTTTNTGTLTLAGASAITGTVGTATNLLNAINAGAGAVSVSGLVDATALNFNGANTVSLNGAGNNAIGTVAFGANDGTLSLGAGANLTGNVTTGVTNTGTVTAAGAETITGALGTGTNLLKAVNVGAGATTITGDVNATTTTITGNNTVTFGGNVNGTTLAFGATTGTATIASGKNLTDAVTGTAASTLSFLGGTQSDTGIINDNLMIINAGATGGATTFNSAVTAATINVTGTGTEEFKAATTGNLNFAAQGTATIDDGVNLTSNASSGGAAGTGVGTLVFGGASTVTGGLSNLKTLTLSSTTAKTVTTTLAVNAADTTNLGVNTLSSGGIFTLAGGQTLNATATGVGTAVGHVTAGANAANVAATSVINLTGLSNAGTYTIVSGTGGTINAAAAGDLKVNGVADTALGTTAFQAGLMTFQEGVAGDALTIVATRNAASTVVGLTANDVAVANVATAIAAGTAPIPAIQAKLISAGTATQLHTDLQSLTPTVDGGAENVAFDLGQETQDIFDTRLASLRSGDATSGVAAGATTQGVSVWFEGYGQHANQHTRDGVDGYKSNTGGGAIGADTKSLGDDTVLGFALNYGASKIDSKNANTTSTDVDAYGLNFYGTYTLPSRMFVNGQAGYDYNKVSSDRHNADLAGNTAHGTTHSDQWSLRADTGRDYAAGYGMTLTPTVFTDYTYLKTLGYTESGAGGADLAVRGQNISAWDLGVGVNAGWKIKADDGNILKPNVHAKYGYDLLNDKVQTTSSFTGDPASTTFITNGAKPARSTFDLGTGVVYATTADWDFSANYDFKFKQDYKSSTGELRATARF